MKWLFYQAEDNSHSLVGYSRFNSAHSLPLSSYLSLFSLYHTIRINKFNIENFPSCIHYCSAGKVFSPFMEYAIPLLHIKKPATTPYSQPSELILDIVDFTIHIYTQFPCGLSLMLTNIKMSMHLLFPRGVLHQAYSIFSLQFSREFCTVENNSSLTFVRNVMYLFFPHFT
jgi:hypothetical protein